MLPLVKVKKEYLLAADYTTGTFTKYIAQHHGEYVDLGLPSGTLWATCNIGANSPEDYGDYFAWGETKGHDSGKNDFTQESYFDYDNNSSTYKKYNNNGGIRAMRVASSLIRQAYRWTTVVVTTVVACGLCGFRLRCQVTDSAPKSLKGRSPDSLRSALIKVTPSCSLLSP